MADSSTDNLTSVETLDSVLEGYRVTRQIGHGAMGVVFEAQQKSLGRRVAIKVLPSSMALRTRTVKRFLREAEAMGRLSHANIVSVYDVGSIRSLHYFSMKYVEGPPLDRVLKAGPLAIADVVQIGIDVASALAHAHAHGVLHRDIKPGNLLRDKDKVVLTDFGLARPLDTDETGTMTESGDLVGTPLYMAPEQISGDTERTDGRADVWGLGVTLYELLTQRPPFSGPNAQGILNSILHKDPPLLRKIRDDVPRDLEAVILKCLEKDPARRYSGAAALVEDLVAVKDGRSVTASTPRFYDPALRWTRRHPVEAMIVGGALMVAAFLGLVARQVGQSLLSTQGQLGVAEKAKQEAEVLRDAAVEARTAARVRYELSEARIAWVRGRTSDNDAECHHAEQRVIALQDSLMLDPERNLDLLAECMTVLAGWVHEAGGDDAETLSLLDAHTQVLDDDVRPVIRAAILTGLEQFDQALALHREQTLRHPTDPRPYLDSARIMRLRGLAARRDGRPNELFGYALQALRLHDAAIDLATRAEDTTTVVRVYVERGRSLIDLERYDEALASLAMALEQDESRVDAASLVALAELKRAQANERNQVLVRGPRAVVATDPGDGAASVEEAGFPLEGLREFIPTTPALSTEDLESAGRGLQSIYRGLYGILRDTAEPEEEAEGAATPPGESSP